MSPGASTCSRAAFMPSVKTGGCSRNQISSRVSGPRCSVKACIARHVGSYSAPPSHLRSGWLSAIRYPLQSRVVAFERALGAIARAHQRPGDAFEETFRQRPFAIARKFFRRYPALDSQVVRRRPQILTEREQIDARGTDVVHRCGDFFVGLAETEHQAGLREHVRAEALGVIEHLECLLVAGARIAHRMCKASHRLDVLSEHVEPASYHCLDIDEHALEVGCESFDRSRRVQALDLAHARC